MLRQFIQLTRTNANYRRLLTANLTSLFGDWFNFVAITTVVINQTDQSSAIAWIFIIHMIPFVIFTPLAGVVADRFSRRQILMLTDLGRFIIVLGFLPIIWFASVTGILIWLFVQYIFAAFFEPAKSAMVPDTVDAADLYPANAGLAAGWSTMMAVGMALGGLTVAVFGVEIALVMDALTYLISYVMIRKMDVHEQHMEESPPVKLSHLIRMDDYLASIRYLKAFPSMIPVVLSKGVLEVSTGAFVFYMTIMAEMTFNEFGDAALSIGLLQAARGIGTGVGPVLARRFVSTLRGEYLSLSLYLLIIPIAYYLVSLQSSIWLAMMFVFLAHTGGGANWVISENMIHQLAPNRIRGRIISFEYLILTLIMAISTKSASILLDDYGWTITEGITIFVIIGVLFAVGWGLWSWTMRNQIQQSETPPAVSHSQN